MPIYPLPVFEADLDAARKDAVARVGEQIVAELRANLRGAWNDLPADERRLIEAAAHDLARLGAEAIALPFNAEAEAHFRREAAAVGATLANLAVARTLRVQEAVAKTASLVFARAAQVAVAALTAAI